MCKQVIDIAASPGLSFQRRGTWGVSRISMVKWSTTVGGTNIDSPGAPFESHFHPAILDSPDPGMIPLPSPFHRSKSPFSWGVSSRQPSRLDGELLLPLMVTMIAEYQVCQH